MMNTKCSSQRFVRPPAQLNSTLNKLTKQQMLMFTKRQRLWTMPVWNWLNQKVVNHAFQAELHKERSRIPTKVLPSDSLCSWLQSTDNCHVKVHFSCTFDWTSNWRVTTQGQEETLWTQHGWIHQQERREHTHTHTHMQRERERERFPTERSMTSAIWEL